MSGTSAIVLLSGGLDSSVNLYWAHSLGVKCRTLTIDYGQQASRAEIRTARKLAANLGCTHEIVELPFLGRWSDSDLNRKGVTPPSGDEVSIDDFEASTETAKRVWVYNRNGIFIAIAAALAEKNEFGNVLVGFNKEEAATFPDNRPEFIEASNSALRFSTSNQVEVICYTSHLTKTEIVQAGRKLSVPWDQLWPCYLGGERPCGTCESCQRFHRALDSAAESA